MERKTIKTLLAAWMLVTPLSYATAFADDYEKLGTGQPQGSLMPGTNLKEDFANAHSLYSQKKYIGALVTLRKLEKSDYPPALNLIGRMYFEGAGVKKNNEEALRYFTAAAEKGFAEAQYNLGAMYFSVSEIKNIRIAIALFQKAAAKGDLSAQNILGYIYSTGQGVPKDLAKATEWYGKAAAQGDPSACHNIASMYYSGQYFEQNDRLAAEWFAKAADKGHTKSLFTLATMYFEGRGVPRNIDKAKTLYRAAAEKGYQKAQYNLAMIYYGEDAQPEQKQKNLEEAAKWFSVAAANGDPDSQYHLGYMLFMGQGVQEDAVQAFKWTLIAAKNRHHDADKALEVMRANMKPEDITEAQRLADGKDALQPVLNFSPVKKHHSFGLVAVYLYIALCAGAILVFSLRSRRKDAPKPASNETLPPKDKLLMVRAEYAKAKTEKAERELTLQKQLENTLNENKEPPPSSSFPIPSTEQLAPAQDDGAKKDGPLSIRIVPPSQQKPQTPKIELGDIRISDTQNTPKKPDTGRHKKHPLKDTTARFKITGKLKISKFSRGDEDTDPTLVPPGQAPTNLDKTTPPPAPPKDQPKNPPTPVNLEKKSSDRIKKALGMQPPAPHVEEPQKDAPAPRNEEENLPPAQPKEEEFPDAPLPLDIPLDMPEDSGEDNSQFMLERAIQCYSDDKYSEAAEFLQPLADKGNVQAQTMLGTMRFQGTGVPQDFQLAEKYLSAAAEGGDSEARMLLAKMYYTGAGVKQDYGKALLWLSRSAEQGNAEARFFIGTMYYTGKGLRQDYINAAKSFAGAAEKNHPQAQFMLAKLYHAGRGLPQDIAAAIRWYTRAAEQGESEAQLSLGKLYIAGEGTKQDFSAAFKWLSEASVQGNPDAQVLLATCYLYGKGTDKNYSKALPLFTEAAEQDDAEAQYCIGLMLANGFGTEKNMVSALKWWILAVRKNHREAVRSIENLRGKMSSLEISEAEALAADFSQERDEMDI